MRFVRPKQPSVPIKARDLKKSSGIDGALTLVSADTRLKEIQEGFPPQAKVTLNVTRRGKLEEITDPLANSTKDHALRRLWNKTMPVLHCSNCVFSQQCPQFRSGYECAFLPFINSHSIKSEKDLLFYAKELCTEGVRRAQIMLLMERLSGAKPDIDTTEALSVIFNQIMELHERVSVQESATFEAAAEGTIIGKLFGDLSTLLGRTRTLQAKPIQSAVCSEEFELIHGSKEPKRIGNTSLISELALVKGGAPSLTRFSDAPSQESLP